ncbi:MAG: hypothetical protein PHF37_02310 [Phycisphaerae bacterium]|nr:hypothetical protein [Phycisphaerae bacterium]
MLNCLCEDAFLDKANELIEQAKEAGKEIILPVDTVIEAIRDAAK